MGYHGSRLQLELPDEATGVNQGVGSEAAGSNPFWVY